MAHKPENLKKPTAFIYLGDTLLEGPRPGQAIKFPFYIKSMNEIAAFQTMPRTNSVTLYMSGSAATIMEPTKALKEYLDARTPHIKREEPTVPKIISPHTGEIAGGH